MFIVPQLCALPYVATHYRDMPAPTLEVLMNDKTFVLIVVAGFLPAHVLTLILAWAVASRFGKISPANSLGLSWPRNLRFWKSIGLAFLLFLIAWFITYTIGGQDTELEKILRSSRAAALILAFIAAVTAPLMEEVIYRGILYSALQRVTGAVIAVLLVTSIFAGLHVWQYRQNLGAILAISLLSLVLTILRARTGRLLPCYVVHLVFNGITSVIIVIEPYLKSLLELWRRDTATGILQLLSGF